MTGLCQRFSAIFAILILGGLLVAGCRPESGRTITPDLTATLPVITPTPHFMVTAFPITITSSPTPIIPDTGWELLQPGLERRFISILDDNGGLLEHLYLLRLDPVHFEFDIAYHPAPQTLDAWQAETGALVVVNGGYFRREEDVYIPNGLTIIDGERLGMSYGDYAGMLAITQAGPELRWLAHSPFDPGEQLSAALQSFPLLVKPGGELGFPAVYEDNQQARRTVIAQDQDGRVLFLAASRGHFTLHQLSVYLTETDLDLEIALNLDGGPSTGLLLAAPWEQIPAIVSLPVVITVHPR